MRKANEWVEDVALDKRWSCEEAEEFVRQIQRDCITYALGVLRQEQDAYLVKLTSRYGDLCAEVIDE